METRRAAGESEEVVRSQRVQGGFVDSVPLGQRASASFGRELIGHLKSLLRGKGLVIELGSSTGVLTGQLQRAGVEVVAVERSRMDIEQLRRALPVRPVIQGDLGRLPLRSLSVGAVLWATPAPPTADPASVEAVVVEARRILRPGGELVGITGQSEGVVQSCIGDLFDRSETSQVSGLTVSVWS